MAKKRKIQKIKKGAIRKKGRPKKISKKAGVRKAGKSKNSPQKRTKKTKPRKAKSRPRKAKSRPRKAKSAKPRPKKTTSKKIIKRINEPKQNILLNLIEEKNSIYKPKMRVVGIGGGGGSIISEIAPRIKKVDFLAANTDIQALKGLAKECKIFQFGQNLTYGLGCGMDPRIGAKAALDEREKIDKIFQGVDLTVIVASLGGGTSSGAAPEFVKAAKEAGSLTFGVFTLPFQFEGEKKSFIAKNALDKLSPDLNIVTIIPNDAIFQFIDKKTPLKQALSAVNKLLAEGLEGLVEMIYLPGLINIDFADLRSTLGGRGKLAYFKTALAGGQDRAEAVSKELLKNPLNEYNIRGAEKILFNITASKDLKMKEVEQISGEISDFNKKAQIIFGVSQNQKYGDNIRITLLAVGCGKKEELPRKNNGKSVKSLRPALLVQAVAPGQKENNLSQEKPKLTEKSKQGQGQPIVKKPREKPRGKKKNEPPKEKPISSPRRNLPQNENLPPKKEENVSPKSGPITESGLNIPAPKQNIISPPRRNALELKKEVEHLEQEMLNQEKKWDIPAFLRKKRTAQ